MKARRNDYKIYELDGTDMFHCTALDDREFFTMLSNEKNRWRFWTIREGKIITGITGIAWAAFGDSDTPSDLYKSR